MHPRPRSHEQLGRRHAQEAQQAEGPKVLSPRRLHVGLEGLLIHQVLLKLPAAQRPFWVIFGFFFLLFSEVLIYIYIYTVYVFICFYMFLMLFSTRSCSPKAERQTNSLISLSGMIEQEKKKLLRLKSPRGISITWWVERCEAIRQHKSQILSDFLGQSNPPNIWIFFGKAQKNKQTFGKP